jgi:protein-tyrosine phosphatase
MRILFVCLGNICRSPAAEGIFNHLIVEKGLEKVVRCDSAGIVGYHEGDGAYPKMKSIARKRGYELASISRPVRAEKDFENFDLIIGMDDQNIADLIRMAPDLKAKAKIHKMTEYCTRHRMSIVPDPYYGETKDYELVIDLLEDACEGLIEKIKATGGNP